MAKKTWKQMTKAEKRVAIAKDVLKVLDLRNVKAARATGYFREVDGPNGDFGCTIPKKNTCTVCAKGGLMLAFMDRFKFSPPVIRLGIGDGAVVKEVGGKMVRTLNEKYISKKLRPIFGQNMLDDMEALFEGSGKGFWSGCNIQSQIAWGENFRKFLFGDDKKTLRGIMGNIIKNKGALKIEQGPIFYKSRKRAAAKKK